MLKVHTDSDVTQNTNMIDDVEGVRLDDVTAYTSTILNHIAGDELDRALAGVCRRFGRSDAALRAAALENTHPDDIIAALAVGGYTLARLGIESIRR